MLWHCQLTDSQPGGGVVRQNSRQERRRQRERPLRLGQLAISRWPCGMRSDVVLGDAQPRAEVIFLLLDRRRHVDCGCRKESHNGSSHVVSRVRRQQRANGRDQVWSSTMLIASRTTPAPSPVKLEGRATRDVIGQVKILSIPFPRAAAKSFSIYHIQRTQDTHSHCLISLYPLSG